jgi:hypothetical protein
MKIGNYYLDQALDAQEPGLIEFTELDYKTIPKLFRNEKIYSGSSMSLWGYEWDSIIGTVNGRIYRIALTSNLELPVPEITINQIIADFTEQFGEPKKEASTFSHTWQTGWGQINLTSNKDYAQFFSLMFTSNTPYQKTSFINVLLKSFINRFFSWFQRLQFSVLFDKDNERILLLRALEWGNWPLFIVQPIAPVLLLFIDWWKLLIGVMLLDWVWALIRFRYQSIILALFAAIFVRLKWISSIALGIYFLIKQAYFLSILSFLWPIITMLLVYFTPPFEVGRMQNMFRDKLCNRL